MSKRISITITDEEHRILRAASVLQKDTRVAYFVRKHVKNLVKTEFAKPEVREMHALLEGARREREGPRLYVVKDQ